MTFACKKCRNKWSYNWAKNNPEKVKKSNEDYKPYRKEYYSKSETKTKYRNAFLKREYGITIKEYDIMLEKQNGVCSICKRFRLFQDKEYMAVDHCHKTGKVRGILCSNCNRALGLLEDNLEFLENAKIYLKDKK